MAVQKRNDEMVDILTADFIRNLAGAIDYTRINNNFQVKNSVASDESITIAAGYQRLAWNNFTVTGTITVAGDLVILS